MWVCAQSTDVAELRKRALEPLELDSYLVESADVGAGNQSQVLYKQYTLLTAAVSPQFQVVYLNTYVCVIHVISGQMLFMLTLSL